MTIYIARHAEADGNLYRRFHGYFDGWVTENGKRQIELLRNRLDGVRFDAVYSSDLRRATETASAMRGWPVTRTSLREINIPRWDDRSWGDIALNDPDLFETFMLDRDSFVPPEGESMAHAVERMWRTLVEIAQASEGQTIGVVSHSAVLTALLKRIAPGSEFYLDNASLTKLTYREKFHIDYIGETDFLGDISTKLRLERLRETSGRRVNLWFQRATLKDVELIKRYRRDAWVEIYGSQSDFNPRFASEEARRIIGGRDGCVFFGMDGAIRTGLIQMDASQHLLPDSGHIVLIYVEPDKRKAGLGSQLIGEAVSYYRKLGRRSLSLRVWDQNTSALHFYKKMGFTTAGEDTGHAGRLLVLEKPI